MASTCRIIVITIIIIVIKIVIIIIKTITCRMNVIGLLPIALASPVLAWAEQRP